MTAKRTFFTICARNYYGLAQVVRRSVKQHHPEAAFFTFIADGIPDAERADFGDDAVDVPRATGNRLARDKLREMAFKYNLTEFCTAVKPFCFNHVFDGTDADVAIYVDPDILLFSPLHDVFVALAQASIVLTPHIVFPSLHEGKRSDKGILATGVFNLGFLALARSETSEHLLSWWGARLVEQCFIDNHDALFTDQKWLDLVPALFPASEVCAFRHAGANVAPWNFHERQVDATSGPTLSVRRRINPARLSDLPAETRVSAEPLLFVHFSGFDYKKFCEGAIVQNNIEGLDLYPDLEPVIAQYMTQIQEIAPVVLKFLLKPYAHATFANGRQILSFHRRLYRAALEVGVAPGDPFATGRETFFAQLASSGLLSAGNSEAQFDKANKNNLTGMDRKLSAFSWAMRGVKKLIGVERYILLLRLMRPYSRAEAQLHFLDRRFDNRL